MADASPIETVITRQTGVNLTLTMEEAGLLADILYYVGGNVHTSRRRYAKAVASALAKAGAKPVREVTDMKLSPHGIWFEGEPPDRP